MSKIEVLMSVQPSNINQSYLNGQMYFKVKFYFLNTIFDLTIFLQQTNYFVDFKLYKKPIDHFQY